MKMNPQN